MYTMLIAALTTYRKSKDSTGLETKNKSLDSTEVQTKTTGVIPQVQTGTTNLFIFRKCGITINHNRLRTLTAI